MSVELIKQILAPENAPSINGVRAQSKLATAVLENVFQGVIETNGRGITDKYTVSEDVYRNAQIFVNRVLPSTAKPREMGATKNGGSYAKSGSFTQTETVGIDVLTVMDEPIRIPGARQATINVDLLAANVDNYVKRLNTVINGATAASHLMGAWLGEEKGTGYNAINLTSDDVKNGDVYTRFVELNSLLDEGDIAHGIDIFREDSRIAVFKMSFRPILKAKGVLILGGSNYAQSILNGRALANGTVDKTIENGFWGEIDGVPCHGISNESLKFASEFLGLPEGELKANSFCGYVAAGEATARGVSMVDQIKVVDDTAGQGVILQPFTKLGVATWYPLGQSILYRDNADKTGMVKALETIFADNGTDFAKVGFKVKAGASRLYPEFGAITASKANGIKCVAKAEDDMGADHLAAGHYVQTDAAIHTVEEFYKACKATSSVNDDLEHFDGTATAASSLTAGKNVAILCIADDGSVSIANVKATA